MDNLKDAIAGLHDRPDFEFLVKHLNDMKDGYVGDLTSTAIELDIVGGDKIGGDFGNFGDFGDGEIGEGEEDGDD